MPLFPRSAKTLFLLPVLSFLVGINPVYAQTAPASPAPAFEVSSVRPSNAADGNSHSGFDGARFSATNCSLKLLIQYDSYVVPDYQIMGGPTWLGSARFDVEAKLDSDTYDRLKALSPAQSNPMKEQIVQQLLTDRFKLAVHWETLQRPVYALVVAKNGAKLTPTKRDDTGTGTSSGTGHLDATGISMPILAARLTQMISRDLGRVVIDRTSIDGRYDLALRFTPDNLRGDAAAADGVTAPSLFTAIQEQLGLKLEPTTGPVQVLVIDHAEKPAEN